MKSVPNSDKDYMIPSCVHFIVNLSEGTHALKNDCAASPILSPISIPCENPSYPPNAPPTKPPAIFPINGPWSRIRFTTGRAICSTLLAIKSNIKFKNKILRANSRRLLLDWLNGFFATLYRDSELLKISSTIGDFLNLNPPLVFSSLLNANAKSFSSFKMASV